MTEMSLDSISTAVDNFRDLVRGWRGRPINNVTQSGASLVFLTRDSYTREGRKRRHSLLQISVFQLRVGQWKLVLLFLSSPGHTTSASK